jgi:hypothetical protein
MHGLPGCKLRALISSPSLVCSVINNLNLDVVTHDDAVAAIQAAVKSGQVTLLVSRVVLVSEARLAGVDLGSPQQYAPFHPPPSCAVLI